MNLQSNNRITGSVRRLKKFIGLLALGTMALPALAESLPATILENRPLTFEANVGQYEASARFVARGAAYHLSLAPTELRVQLQKVIRLPGTENIGGPAPRREAAQVKRATLQIELLGANQAAVMTGNGAVVGRANYFLGNDPAQWRTGVPAYERVRAADVYPGIHLLHYGNQQHLEYDFEVMPGADPEAIALRFTGADKLSLTSNGDLVLTLGDEEIRQPRPVLYQTVRGQRKEIVGGYKLVDDRTVKFFVGEYDRTVALIIDPIVSYSTYFNETGNDYVWAIATGADGDLYLAGETMTASGLATPGAFQTNLAGVLGTHGDVFISRHKNTSALTDVYVTYLGGIVHEAALGLAVDDDGNAYVTGYTGSTNFPTRFAVQTNIAGKIIPGLTIPPLDCFIAKIGPQGTNLVFSTFYGGAGAGFSGDGDEIGYGIALDAARNIYVTGYTFSTNFPTFNTTATNRNGLEDAFVLKLDAAGTNVSYAMYLGGTNRDYGRDIVVDVAGNPLVVGITGSTNFPVTANAFQLNLNQTTNVSLADDGFIARLESTSGTVTYATFLGGTNNDQAIRLATDSTGAAYVTGSTRSGDFPQTGTNFVASVSTNTSAADVFVVKLNPANTNLDYAVVFGGSGKDEGWDVAVDAQGQAYVTGETASSNFPTNSLSGILRGVNSGGIDAFFAQINSNGTAFIYSAYLGGAQTDRGYGVTVDAGGNSYFTGETIYSTFPTSPTNNNTGFTDVDAFIVKMIVPPALTIAATGTNVAVSWPGFTEFALQSSTNLVATNNAWVGVTNTAVFTNGQHVVTLPGTNSLQFFRLIK